MMYKVPTDVYKESGCKWFTLIRCHYELRHRDVEI